MLYAFLPINAASSPNDRSKNFHAGVLPVVPKNYYVGFPPSAGNALCRRFLWVKEKRIAKSCK